MNKFTKVILILAAVFFGVGLACTVAAFVMGASLDTLRAVTVYFDDMKDLGIRHIQGEDFSISLVQSDNDILPDIDIDFSGNEEEVKVSGELSQMSSYKGIRTISLEVGASTIDISYADVEQVEVYYEDAVGMDMEFEAEELDITCRASGNVEILVPQEAQLDSIDLDIGAGQVRIHDIYFKDLDADIGAGELVIQAPEAKTAYNYNVDCALGEVSIGDETYAGISSTDKDQGGNRNMDIDCGAGRVEIQFAQ